MTVFPEYTCEKCGQPIKFETYKDMNLVLWVNHNEPDHAMCLGCWDSLSEKEKTKIYDKAVHKPQIYQQGKMAWWYPKKDRLIHRIIEYLNDEKDYRTKFYDCGEFGILSLWWNRGTWESSWVRVQPLPDSLRGELEANDHDS